MEPDSLAEEMRRLTPEQQAAVRDFIKFLKQKSQPAPNSPFLAAIDEFIESHPELLRRLAQ